VNPKGRRFVRLPNYPWQRKRYWFKRQSERAGRRRVTGAVAAHSAGLPGRRLHVAVPTFESQVDPDLRAFALDHRVDGGAFVPASLFVELGLAAAERALGPGAYGIEDLSIDEPLVCREGDARTVQVTLPGVENGAYTFQVHSAVEREDEAGATWTLHAAGAVRAVQLDDAAAEETRDVSSVRARCPDEMDAAAFYESLERAGIRLAGAYRVVDRCWRGDGEVLVRMRVPADTGHG